MKNFESISKLGDQSASYISSNKLYDIASITKAHTSYLIISLIISGYLKLEHKMGDFFKDIDQSLALVTIEDLLLYKIYFDYGKYDSLAQWALSNPSNSVPKYVFSLRVNQIRSFSGEIHYNNSNSIILGEILKFIYKNESLGDIFMEKIYKDSPVGSPRYLPRKGFVESSLGYKNFPHDPSAFTSLKQGIELGSAGLFASANQMLFFGEKILSQKKIWNKISKLKVEDKVSRIGLGFFKPSLRFDFLPMDCIKMSGYTGCSMYLSASQNLVFIFLSTMRINMENGDRIVSTLQKDLLRETYRV